MTATRIASLQREAERYRCAEHDGRLYVAAREGSPRLLCRDCHGPPPRLVEVPTLTQEFKRGGALPAPIAAHLSRALGSRESMTTSEIALIQPTEDQLVASGEMFAQQLEGFGKGLAASEKVLAAQLHIGLGMQPFHFNLIHGRLYVNVDGRTFAAQKQMGASYGGIEIAPLSAGDRALWLIPDGDVAVMATLFRLVGGQRIIHAQDIGRAGGPRDAGQQGNPVGKANPQEQAIARATVRVLRKGAPLGVVIPTYEPALDEVLDAPVEEQPTSDAEELERVVDPEWFGGRRVIPTPVETVDKATGEVKEAAQATMDVGTSAETLAIVANHLRDHFAEDLEAKDAAAKWQFNAARGQRAIKAALAAGHSPAGVARMIAGIDQDQ